MKIASLILGYVAAILIGWGFAKANNPSPEESKSPAKSLQPQSKVLTSSQLLDDLIASERSEKPVRILLNEAIADLEPTDDPENALLDYYEKIHDSVEQKRKFATGFDLLKDPEMVKLGALFAHWFDADPLAAVQKFATLDSAVVGGNFDLNYVWPALKNRLKEDGIQNSMNWLREAEKMQIHLTHENVFEAIGESGSINDLLYLQENEPTWFESVDYAVWLGESWPFQQRDELLPHLDEKVKHHAILKIARQKGGSEALDWFLDIYRDEETSSVVREKIRADSYDLFEIIQQSDYSPADRTALHKEFGRFRALDDQSARAEVIDRDLRSFFSNWEEERLYAFHSGTTTANELYDSLLQEFPSLKKEPGLARGQLFRSLAEVNFEAASQLYETEGPKVLDQQKLDASRWEFHDADPNQFFNMLNSIETSTTDETVRTRLADSWNNKTPGNIARYGESYLEWVRKLPEGQNRDFALQAIVNIGPSTMAEQARKLLNP